jgi:chromosome segregation ATPase
MDSMNLKDYRSDPSSLPREDEVGNLQPSEYHQEINTLKIEKLSNRITIISVIIPCLICAILIFVYLDIKERVVDVDTTKKLQVEEITRQFEEKLNSLDIRIAKNKFDFDQNLPQLTKKEQALENQVAKMAASKADAKTLDIAIAKLDKKIGSNAVQNKKNVKALEEINQQLLAAIKENNVQFKKRAGQIKEEITIFKKEFDARLQELLAYEDQIGILRKNTSLLDKKINELAQEKTSAKDLDKRLIQFNQSLEKRIQDLDKKLEQKISKMTVKPEKSLSGPSSPKSPVNKIEKKESTDNKPEPQIDMGKIISDSISQESLKE